MVGTKATAARRRDLNICLLMRTFHGHVTVVCLARIPQEKWRTTLHTTSLFAAGAVLVVKEMEEGGGQLVKRFKPLFTDQYLETFVAVEEHLWCVPDADLVFISYGDVASISEPM